MTHYLSIIVSLLLVTGSGCRKESTETSPPKAAVDIGAPSPNVLGRRDLGGPREPVKRWRRSRLARPGQKFILTRSEEGVRADLDGVALLFGRPSFGDCVEELPSPGSPEALPSASVRARPVWLSLESEDDRASIRLSTRSALLVVSDGCTRVAPVHPELLGVPSSDDDPLFAAGMGVPDDASEVARFTSSPTEDGSQVLASEVPLLSVKHFAGETAVTGYEYDGRSWLRFLVHEERESDDGDSVVGREHTIGWELVAGAPDLRVDVDYRFGAEGPDREDERLSSVRRHHQKTGTVVVEGSRKRVADALNVGAGRCPEMEGAVVFERIEESVRWSFETRSGVERELGRATWEATFASGCPDVASEELRKRSHLMADRAPADSVSWSTITQPAD